MWTIKKAIGLLKKNLKWIQENRNDDFKKGYEKALNDVIWLESKIYHSSKMEQIECLKEMNKEEIKHNKFGKIYM